MKVSIEAEWRAGPNNRSNYGHHDNIMVVSFDYHDVDKHGPEWNFTEQKEKEVLAALAGRMLLGFDEANGWHWWRGQNLVTHRPYPKRYGRGEVDRTVRSEWVVNYGYDSGD